MSSKHWEKYLKIGRAIKELREEKGLTQEQLAQKAGASTSYISKIEAPNYKKSFSLEIVFEICQVLGEEEKEVFKYL